MSRYIIPKKKKMCWKCKHWESRSCSQENKRGIHSHVSAGKPARSSCHHLSIGHARHAILGTFLGPQGRWSLAEAQYCWSWNRGARNYWKAHRRSTEPRPGGSGCLGWWLTGPDKQRAEGVWRSIVKTGAGTSIMNLGTSKYLGMAGMNGTSSRGWDRMRSWQSWVLSQGRELHPESQEEPLKNFKQGSNMMWFLF